ncbi:RNase adapter RapZ [Nereida sp. MMG025]|uniref:RNase adapter RapZ n=1 Tax=Nereida sp. MMG025 TaxID=2909981 RepID=UPI001F02AC3E|nr:RNase adapter RapZ [Nereida sp. MMG025]MCF6445948.1 RNase adapter RapZ [Nereida sp. MMG025]
MTDADAFPQSPRPKLVLVTGPSGAGRSTAINALEDAGSEAIDNMPLSLVPRLLDGPPLDRPLALSMDVRNRDFSVEMALGVLDDLRREGADVSLLYLDATPEVLLQRFSETRRRHPMAPFETPLIGITRELDLLRPLREQADYLIDTTTMTPHDLKADLRMWFGQADTGKMAVMLHSFSYKRGVPRGLDSMFDCRFLANPYWDETLRDMTGQSPKVQAYVQTDPTFGSFFDTLLKMTVSLLPAYAEEGKTHFSLGFGCTGGQHRSVTVTELLAKALAQAGWQVSIRHRELERRRDAPL